MFYSPAEFGHEGLTRADSGVENRETLSSR